MSTMRTNNTANMDYEYVSNLPFVHGKIRIDIKRIPHESKYMPIDEFCNTYDVSRNSLDVLSLKYPHIRVKFGRFQIYVNEGLLIAIRDFKIDLRNKAQELYFALTEHVNESQIAKALANRTGRTAAGWMSFLQKELFIAHDYSVTKLDANNRIVEFLHYGEKILKLVKQKK